MSAKINEGETYSLLSLVKLKALPGVKSFTAAKNLVMRDRMGANVLRAQIMGDGRATRIYIKGKNVLDYQQANK